MKISWGEQTLRQVIAHNLLLYQLPTLKSHLSYLVPALPRGKGSFREAILVGKVDGFASDLGCLIHLNDRSPSKFDYAVDKISQWVSPWKFFHFVYDGKLGTY